MAERNIAEVVDVTGRVEVSAPEPIPDTEDIRADGSVDRRGASERMRLKGGVVARVSTDVQYDQNGMKMSDYFNPANVPQDIKDAVREDREERGAKSPNHTAKTLLNPLGQPFAIFRHTEFTQEEDEAICAGIQAGIPLYLIAEKLKTSRGVLSRHIKESKLLSQAFEDLQESILDHVEYKAKKLVDSGNPAMIMFWLERKGRLRGWGSQEIAQVGEEDDRIVIGEIPEKDVTEAEERQAKANEEVGIRLTADGSAELGTFGGVGGSLKLPSPMEVAQTMQAVSEMEADNAKAEQAAERKRAQMRANSVDVESVSTVPVGVPEGPSSIRVEPESVARQQPQAPDDGGFGADEYDLPGVVRDRAPWDEGSGWEPYGF